MIPLRHAVLLCVLVSTFLLCAAQQAYQKKALDLHNKYRAKHRAPALQSDNKLLDVAGKCAKYYASIKQINHKCPYKNNMGENLAGGSGSWTNDQFAEMSTNMWYNEEKNYNYSNPGFASNTGHFTQVVWVSSKTFGFGYATNGSYTVGVGLYSPPGNYAALFPSVCQKFNVG